MTSLAKYAHADLGEPGAANTCLRAVNRWAKEAGAHSLPTESVSAAVRLVSAGEAPGWAYHEGLDGAKEGDVLRWARAALHPTSADPNPEHVSVWTDTDAHGRIKSIGSGGPSGKVAEQPSGGGYNDRSVFRGYFRVTVSSSSPQAPAKPAAKPSSSKGDIVVRKGDTLTAIAKREGTTIAHLLAANPRRADGVTSDYHITRANWILAGQRLHRP